MPLGLLGSGESAEIMEIRENNGCHQGGHHGHGRCNEHSNRIEDMGLRVGKQVEMLNNEGRGPLLVRVDESRIAMARGMAMKILVRRREE